MKKLCSLTWEERPAVIRQWVDLGCPDGAPEAEAAEFPEEPLRTLGVDLPKDHRTFLQTHQAGVRFEWKEDTWDLAAADRLRASARVRA